MEITSDYTSMSWMAMPLALCSESATSGSEQGFLEQRDHSQSFDQGFLEQRGHSQGFEPVFLEQRNYGQSFDQGFLEQYDSQNVEQGFFEQRDHSQSLDQDHHTSTSPNLMSMNQDLSELSQNFSQVQQNFINITQNNLYSPFVTQFHPSNSMLNTPVYYNFNTPMSNHVSSQIQYQVPYQPQLTCYQPIRVPMMSENFESKPTNFDFSRPKPKRRTHSEPRNHVCTLCQKRFTRPSSLKTHRLTHTGEKPFPCLTPSCGKAFSVLSNLRRHYRVHAKRERKLAAKNQHRLLATPAGAMLSFMQ